MKLVLQCAMCGTHHAVGTAVCSTCRASGVNQLRLMFECQTCGRLGLNPVCETCPCSPPPPAVYPAPVVEPELSVADEVFDDPLTLEEADDDLFEDLGLDIDEADVELVVDETEEDLDEDELLDDDAFDLDEELEYLEDDEEDLDEDEPDDEEDSDEEDFDFDLEDEEIDDFNDDDFDEDFDEDDED